MQASAHHDWGMLYDTFTPDSRRELVGTLAYGVMTADESSEEKRQILTKFGIDESVTPNKPEWNIKREADDVVREVQAEYNRLAELIEDRRAFYIEMKTLMQKEAADTAKTSPLTKYIEQQSKAQAAARLVDVEIDGERAVGQRTWDSGNGFLRTPVFFERINDKWFVRQATFEEGKEMGSSLYQQIKQNRNADSNRD